MKRLVIVLFLSWIAIFGVLSFQGCTSEQPIDPPVHILPVELDNCFPEPDKGCCDELAGRYHLRGRTKRFFGRVS
jgi:hypothetical protein